MNLGNGGGLKVTVGQNVPRLLIVQDRFEEASRASTREISKQQMD